MELTVHTLRERSVSHTHFILITCTEVGTHCATNINLTHTYIVCAFCLLQCKLCEGGYSSPVIVVLAQLDTEGIITLNQTN